MPTLYVVPTPIGNLQDITLRSLEVLRSVGLILAEDTRHSARLLRHFGIGTSLLSYHQHNKRARIPAVLHALDETDVALVSNAGMPSIADPGFELIRAVRAAGLEVDVLPGPSAVVTAVVAAAIPAPGFVFVGFLPRKSGERRKRLQPFQGLPFALVAYETPHRLLASLRDLLSELGDRHAVVARELTKVHQEVIEGTLSDLARRFEGEEPRGEITVVVAGASDTDGGQSIDASNDLRARAAKGEDSKTAIEAVIREHGLSRNEAYRLWLGVLDGSEC